GLGRPFITGTEPGETIPGSECEPSVSRSWRHSGPAAGAPFASAWLSRTNSVSKSRSTCPVVQVRPTSDLVANDGAVPCSGDPARGELQPHFCCRRRLI